MIENNDFASLGLSPRILEAVKAKGFEAPTPIQRLTIPKLLTQSNDIIAQAQTGTGKTAAFGLPVMQQLTPAAGHVQAIILAPTRELALQVSEELHSYNKGIGLSIASIYGGASMSEQLRRLSKGIDIVVGTPGRTLDHIRRGTLDLSGVRFLILDEADEMLNMGFIEDVEEIMRHTPEQRRVMLFSATMPDRIVKLSRSYMRDTEIVRVEMQQLTTELTDQIYFEVRESDKFDALTRIIDIQPEFYGIVFCRTRTGVDEVTGKLLERGYAAEGLHGEVSQAQREKTLRKFKKKQVTILVATDVAARGIDIINLTHVINYSLPQDSESYVHRIGRTGRAGNMGTAITFISSAEFRRFGFMKRDIKVDIKKEELPSAQDVVATKREKIKDDLREIVEGEHFADYGDMADELLALYPPDVALSALLRLAFRSELDLNNYPEIRSFSVDRKGTARLFLAIGRMDGYDVRKLVALLKRECGLTDSKITDIKLSENYSFVSVPFNDAEHVVRKLNNIRKGRRPLAEIAAPEGEGRKKKKASGSAEEKPAAKRPEHKESSEFSDGEPIEERLRQREEKKARAAGKRGSTAPAPAGKTGDGKVKPRTGAQAPAVRKKTTKTPAAASHDDFSPSPENNAGFDWSAFETADNRWDDRPDKKRPKKR